MIPPLPKSTLFPYTTLFRSIANISILAQILERNMLIRIKKLALINSLIDDNQFLLPKQCKFRRGYFKLTLLDRKSTRLNSSHITISYAVFCLKKKNKNKKYI